MQQVGDTARYGEANDKNEMVADIIMFVIQYFPIDLMSLQSSLALSKDFNEKITCNTLMWLALAKRASLGCQACFLEARDSARISGVPGAQYWRDVMQVLTAATSLRRQWGLRAAHRTFVNTGACHQKQFCKEDGGVCVQI